MSEVLECAKPDFESFATEALLLEAQAYCLWLNGVPAEAYRNEQTGSLYLRFSAAARFDLYEEAFQFAHAERWCVAFARWAQKPFIEFQEKKRRRPTVREELRVIGLRDGWFCHYCHIPLCPVDVPASWFRPLPEVEGNQTLITSVLQERAVTWPQRDHKVPRFFYGTDHIDNLVLSCASCNGRKGYRKAYEEFYAATQPLRDART